MWETYVIGGLTILALLAGPFIGIYTQKWIENKKEHRSKQLDIFRTLMATRAETESKEHVRALNLIDIEFSNKRKEEKPVIAAWRVLLDQLESYPRSEDYDSEDDEIEYKIDRRIFEDKSDKCLNDLLLVMSKYFDYELEKISIKNDWYVPSSHEDEEEVKRLMRNGLLNLLAGETHLNVNMKTLPKKPSGKKAKK